VKAEAERPAASAWIERRSAAAPAPRQIACLRQGGICRATIISLSERFGARIQGAPIGAISCLFWLKVGRSDCSTQARRMDGRTGRQRRAGWLVWDCRTLE